QASGCHDHAIGGRSPGGSVGAYAAGGGSHSPDYGGTARGPAPMSPGDSAIAVRTRRHVTRRLAPFLFLLYVLNYLDRVNISYAALQMTGDLKFSNAVFGFGAGIFFIGYFLLQVPGTMLIELWSARKFIGTSLIVWGMLATLTGLITNGTKSYSI